MGRKKKIVPVEEVEMKAEAPVLEEVKEEAVNAEPVKEETEVKEEVKKATKKTAAKTAEKETTKKTTKKAVEPVVVVQFGGQETDMAAVIENAKKAFEAEGNKVSSIKEIRIYVKPEENAAYYVINGESGSVDLF